MINHFWSEDGINDGVAQALRRIYVAENGLIDERGYRWAEKAYKRVKRGETSLEIEQRRLRGRRVQFW